MKTTIARPGEAPATTALPTGLFLDEPEIPFAPSAAASGSFSSAVRAAVPGPQTAPAWRDRLVFGTLALALRHKVFATLLFSVCVIAAGLNTLRMDPYYVATASLFPAASQSPVGAFGFAGLAGLVGNLGIAPGGSSQFPIYENVVHSARLGSQLLATPLPGGGTLLDHLDIAEPDATLRQQIALGVVSENLTYDTDKKTGLVLVSFRDRDPQVAAAVANRTLELLDAFDVATATDLARAKRAFVEAQLAEARVKLDDAEARVETFGEENLRIGRAPELLLEQARLERELRIEQEVYLALRKEAEMARIEEQRALPSIHVLDRASPPASPAGPSLPRNLVLGAVLGAFLVAGVFGLVALSPRRLLGDLMRLGRATA